MFHDCTKNDMSQKHGMQESYTCDELNLQINPRCGIEHWSSDLIGFLTHIIRVWNICEIMMNIHEYTIYGTRGLCQVMCCKYCFTR